MKYDRILQILLVVFIAMFVVGIVGAITDCGLATEKDCEVLVIGKHYTPPTGGFGGKPERFLLAVDCECHGKETLRVGLAWYLEAEVNDLTTVTHKFGRWTGATYK